MAEMLAEYLSPEGYTVELSYTAKAGLNRLKEGGLVLIILDVMLPDRNGMGVLHEIRQSSRIPVIMLTTLAPALFSLPNRCTSPVLTGFSTINA